ncbi:uncharacterized protein LOC141643895 isoform X2 [Silene latifolia]|uniref:uncharacterized protein LOC141643895 isoform X2 n=1 Tax=Silene latifolia TaxID=37657 RepID=UPI003D77AF68
MGPTKTASAIQQQQQQQHPSLNPKMIWGRLKTASAIWEAKGARSLILPVFLHFLSFWRNLTLSMDSDVETDLDRTSLGKAVAFFRSSFLQPLSKSCKD